jgi:hypothetical protein
MKKSTKSSSRRKATGTTKTGKRRSGVGAKAAAAPATKTFAGERFTKNACGKTKTDAKKAAEGLRKKGKKARVVKSTKGYCVYTRG